MRYTYDDGPSSARYVQQGIVQGGVGNCGSKDFPSIYVRIKDPEVFNFIQNAIGGKPSASLAAAPTTIATTVSPISTTTPKASIVSGKVLNFKMCILFAHQIRQ